MALTFIFAPSAEASFFGGGGGAGGDGVGVGNGTDRDPMIRGEPIRIELYKVYKNTLQVAEAEVEDNSLFVFCEKQALAKSNPRISMRNCVNAFLEEDTQSFN